MDEKYCIIVDPYVNTKHIISQFGLHNVKCIAVLSEPIVPEFKKVRLPEDVEKMFFSIHSLADGEKELLEYLGKYNVIGVVNGSDMGVCFADRLSYALGLKNGNSPKNSLMRRSKYLANKKIREDGISCSKQMLIDKRMLNEVINNRNAMDKLVAAIEEQHTYPLVVKPTQSRGTFGVKICEDRAALRTAIRQNFHRVDVYGEKVVDLVVEELLVGQEYAVDTVSIDGRMYIAGIYIYNKRVQDGTPIYRDMMLIDGCGEEADLIRNYVEKVMTSVEFQFGPAHIELYLTSSGPKLVEINPRVSGAYGFANRLCKILTGRNQIDMLVELYVNPTAFTKKYDSTYRKQGYGKLIMLQNEKQGVLASNIGEKDIRNLKSFQDVKLSTEIGEMLKKTVDFCTCPGVVLLTSDSKHQLETDFQELIKIETENLFVLEKE